MAPTWLASVDIAGAEEFGKNRKNNRSLQPTLWLSSARINLPLFSTVVPAVTLVFLSCRPFVAITTLSTGFVGVEVTSVSWPKPG